LKTTQKNNSKTGVETPLMKQYNEIKAKYPDALLLFRVGDFYETFGTDAVKASSILGIVLTKRANGAAASVELAGFPHHALETYLPKLVRAGYRVAVCDQLEDPKLTKTIVKRGVTELVTPGLVSSDKLLDQQSNHFLCALYQLKDRFGAAFLDHSTGEFLVAEGSRDTVFKLIHHFQPGEVLLARPQASALKEALTDRYFIYQLDDWVFQEDYSKGLLLAQFQTTSLKGFGIDAMPLATITAGACLHYLKDTSHEKTAHITSISRINEDRYMWMDEFTIRNLELVYSMHPQGKSLFDIVNKCQTPMGSRLLKRWINLPLKERKSIEERLDAVEVFHKNEALCSEFSETLKSVGDLERLAAKAAVQRIQPREILALKRALETIIPLKSKALEIEDALINRIADQLQPCELLASRIQRQLVADPPVALHKGDVVAPGVDDELDELRSIKLHGKEFLLNIQQREAERTGIGSLKISYNNVFGYYLEVTNAHKDKVPSDWIRKQTLVNAERYITPEIKEFEEKILGAEEKIARIEARIYSELVAAITEYIQAIQLDAFLMAQLDCLLNFAEIARAFNYCKPGINESFALNIKNGRHPVIEHQLPEGTEYVTNDVETDSVTQQILMITGPNMSGKSALLRQTALICILAQMGSFVPAEGAEIGIVDKIFTRVGASDSISTGESTFMVEMNETASILNNLSQRSLILLDEIGRGTSTYDGLSIAWAIAEYLHENKKMAPRTLFATHYHELNEMAIQFERIKNYHVAVKEVSQKILFLRKLKQGGTNHSFGIHVARMAGMPQPVIKRAEEMRQKTTHPSENKKTTKKTTDSSVQLSFFQLDDPVLINVRAELERVDVNNLTPVEALIKLQEIKRLIGVN
jgi:DNA mismatch repair protein MutS